MQAGLAGADDGDVAHLGSPREIVVGYSISKGIAGSARSGPMAV